LSIDSPNHWKVVAAVEGLEERELVEVLADELGQAEHDRLALLGRPIGPAPVVECPSRRADRPIDVLDAPQGDLRDGRAVTAGDRGVGGAAGGRHVVTVDTVARRVDHRGAGDPVGGGGFRSGGGRHAAYLVMAASSRTAPMPGRPGTWSSPPASGRIGSARTASRRSGVQSGGS
jgi:hypothetical protein